MIVHLVLGWIPLDLLDGFQKRFPVGDFVGNAAQDALEGGRLFVKLLEGVLGAVQSVFNNCGKGLE